MGRAPCCDKANVKKGPWAPEEDAKLKDYIDKYGTGGNWIALPQKIGIKRCGKSCRLRWLNYLRPNIKHGGFSEEEDNTICSLYISIGSRWSIIAAQLPGRTDNDIKNYWNTRLKKKLLGRRKQSNASRLDSNGMETTLSNSAIERLQLHMQLQSINENPVNNNNDISHVPNHLALWPCKLNPIQEKMMHSLQLLNQSSNPINMQNYSTQKVDLYQQMCSLPSNILMNRTDNSVMNGIMNIPESSTQISDKSEFQQYSWELQSEIGQFQSNKGANSVPQDQEQTNEFDFFQDMEEGSKDIMTWWSNELNANSPSSNSWDSNGVLDHQQQ